jgi:hypothetical protein
MEEIKTEGDNKGLRRPEISTNHEAGNRVVERGVMLYSLPFHYFLEQAYCKIGNDDVTVILLLSYFIF